jgi:hypothetical protein
MMADGSMIDRLTAELKDYDDDEGIDFPARP